jgi:hypothetical protein
MIRPKVIAVQRRATIQPDKRTAVQIDKAIHARKATLSKRLSDRPIVHRSASQVHARIVAHGKSLRMKHPEAPGS